VDTVIVPIRKTSAVLPSSIVEVYVISFARL
jgi:hypothetical protein